MYFNNIEKIKFEGVNTKNPLAFKYYDADRKNERAFKVCYELLAHNVCRRNRYVRQRNNQQILRRKNGYRDL